MGHMDPMLVILALFNLSGYTCVIAVAVVYTLEQLIELFKA